MNYEIYEDKLASNFIIKNSKNKELTKQIKEKYDQLKKDPYSCIEDSFKSKKCPKCKKTRIGDYRIIFYISKKYKIVQIIDIDHRKKYTKNGIDNPKK